MKMAMIAVEAMSRAPVFPGCVQARELIEVVPPPAQPLDASDGGLWNALEAKLGVQLPPDWRDFGLHYGSGEFGTHGGYTFWNPFAADTFASIEQVIHILRGNKEAWLEHGV